MAPKDFYNKFIDAAVTSEKETHVPALYKLAAFAIESGWADKMKGNNGFGIKADKSWTGEKMLMATTEYHDTPNIKYPKISKIVKVGNKYKYSVEDWFRAYPTVADSFSDHSQFLIKNKRYAKAFETTDPIEFARRVAQSGYASSPDYFTLLTKVIQMFQKMKK